MSYDYPAQVKTCAPSKVIHLKSVTKKTKRCCPKKLGEPTPATETFEHYAAQIAAIPMDRRNDETPLPPGVRGWNEAKDHARGVVIKDHRLSRAAVSVAIFVIDKINHAKGFDWHGVDHIAEACGLTKKAASDAIARLRVTGHFSRRSKKSSHGDHDHWETTLPTLARAAFVDQPAADEHGGTRQSTDRCPSIVGGVPVNRRLTGTRQSTDLTSSLSKPSSEPRFSDGPPHAGDGGASLSQSGSEVTTRRRRSKMPERFLVGSDGLQHFNENSNYEGNVAGLIVDGYNAQMILKSARLKEPATDPQHVRSALVAATEKFLPEYKPRATLSAVIEWTAKEARRLATCERLGLDPKRHREVLEPDWWRGREAEARGYTDEVWTDAIRVHAGGTWPVDVLGPLPGDPDCLVPYPVVLRLNLIERYGAPAAS